MDRHMEDSSTFLQWAMNQLHHQHPSSAAAAASAYQDGAGAGSSGAGDREAIFPSLHALRSGAQSQPVAASVRVRDLTVQVDHLTNSSSSGDSPGAGAAMDHDAAAGWSPHTARSRTTGLGGGSGSRPVSWNFSAASAQPTCESGGGGVALPDAAVAARVQLASAGRRGGSSAAPAAATAAASSSPGPVQDHIIAEGEDQPAIHRALHRHPRAQEDGQGNHSWGRGEVREGAAGEGQDPRGGRRPQRRRQQHPVGGAREEAVPPARRRGHGEQQWRRRRRSAAAGDRGAAVGEERAAADPLLQREGAAGKGDIGGGADAPLHHPHQRHAIPRLHRHHHHHSQGGGGVHCHGR